MARNPKPIRKPSRKQPWHKCFDCKGTGEDPDFGEGCACWTCGGSGLLSREPNTTITIR
ncbi:hypothetical protein METESE_11920 [Mesoterricola sediminis]|uniref:Uncharacterized protein n=1 Tax=Mesoterricola sediminis TaxID=2927980 RepID=A0AA48KBL3_9BACT|nr:hypothetical protein METESE_11920 [Mesoterricola sediminis]